MANALFPKAREGFLSGAIDWDTAAIKAALVRGYTYDAADEFVSDVTGGGGTITATSPALTGKTVTNGTADADDAAFGTVAAVGGNPGHGVLVFQSSAVGGGADVAASSQRVIAWYDTGTNFPIITNGGDVTSQWSSGADRMFTL